MSIRMMIRHQKQLSYFISFILFLLPASPVFATTWQGPYLGAYVGSGFGTQHLSTSTGTVTDTSYFAATTDINAVNSSGSSTQNPSSAIVGFQAGQDWAVKKSILGIVLDYVVAPINSSHTMNNVTYPDGSNAYSVYTSMTMKWLSTLRGRLGYQTTLHYPALLYLTGGLALAQLKVNTSFSDNTSYAGMGGNSTSQNQIGWTLGAGIELASLHHFSVMLQYLYVSLPSMTTTSSLSNTAGGFGIPPQSLTSPFVTKGQTYTNLVTIGLNYRFDE